MNLAREALTRAVNTAIAAGAPVYENIPPAPAPAYQVLWRADHDQIVNTRVYTIADPLRLEVRDWVWLAAQTDALEFDPDEPEKAAQYAADVLNTGFEFLGVLPGDTEWIA